MARRLGRSQRGMSWSGQSPVAEFNAGAKLLNRPEMLDRSLDDTNIANCGVVKDPQGGLVRLTVVGRDGLRNVVELDNDPPLGKPRFIALYRVAAGKEAPAPGLDRRRRRYFCISRQGIRLGNSVINGHPISFAHACPSRLGRITKAISPPQPVSAGYRRSRHLARATHRQGRDGDRDRTANPLNWQEEALSGTASKPKVAQGYRP